MYQPFTELLPVTPGQIAQYDALEVHGVRDVATDGSGGTQCEVDDEHPQFYSVYLHRKEGGVECVGDFSAEADANTFATELHQKYGYPVTYGAAQLRALAPYL